MKIVSKYLAKCKYFCAEFLEEIRWRKFSNLRYIYSRTSPRYMYVDLTLRHSIAIPSLAYIMQAEKEDIVEQNKPEFLKVSLKKTAQSQAC